MNSPLKNTLGVIVGALVVALVLVVAGMMVTGAPIDPDIQRVPVQFYLEAGGDIVGVIWLGDAFGAAYADAQQIGNSLFIDGVGQFYQPDGNGKGK